MKLTMNAPFSKPATNAAKAPDEAVTLDFHQVLTCAGGDPETLILLCGNFLSELPIHLNSLQSAIAARNYLNAGRILERLRGSLLIFGSGQLFYTAEILEQAVRTRRYHQVRSQWKQFRAQLQLLIPQVQRLMLEMTSTDGSVQ